MKLFRSLADPTRLRMVAVLQDLGIEADWQLIEGSEEFFSVTKLVFMLWLGLAALLVGLALDGVLLLIPPTGDLVLRWIYLVVGIVLNGIATGAYIGAGLGPGPRDGLMVGFARGGRSLRVVRTVIEVSVLVVGWLLGGTVGIGTVLYAMTIGPIVHRTVPVFSRGRP